MNSNILSSILSTRQLTPVQKEPFLNSGISLVEYDAIRIDYLDFTLPKSGQNAIFTSQNAVRAVFENPTLIERNDLPSYTCFCVGEKTKQLLERNGQKVIKKSKNAQDLALFISKYHKNESFIFFSGNLRRPELPTTLKSEKIDLLEIKSYKTELNPMFFDQNFDKILFFSPSGVQSFMLKNTIGNSMAICIGKTTATEAKKYSNNVIQSYQNSIESVIELALKN